MRAKIRLLYAEDDPRDVDLTTKHFALEASEFEIEIARTGEKCLELLQTNVYDILLLDYRLPDMDGLDVLRKAVRAGFLLPVVVITGAGDEDIVVKSLRSGASDYVIKTGDYLSSLPRVLRGVVEELKINRRIKAMPERRTI